MAVTTATKVSVNIRLNDGVDEQGNPKFVSVSLGKLSLAGFDADKALNIRDLLAPCFDKTIFATEKIEVSTLARS